MGCDNNFLKTDYSEVKISIHAPTWGATSTKSMMISTAHYFNPRTHLGCDQRVQTDRPAAENFNPRTHMGCDRTAMYGLDTLRMISIHAPTWGATANALLTKHGYVISIHAPTWGATVPTAAYAFVRG